MPRNPIFPKKYILPWILIVLLNGFECQPISENIWRFITATRFNKGKELQFRREGRGYNFYDGIYTRNIPSEDTFFQGDYPPLPCWENHYIARKRYVYFGLGSGLTKCYYGFLGSQSRECTVGVYCSGIISFAPKSNMTNRCEQDYFILSDGGGGRMTGCGDFSFHNTPRYPLIGGTKIAVTFRGFADNTRCIAFCMEDVQPGMYGLKPPQPLSTPEQPVSQEWQVSQRMQSECKCGIRGNSGRVVGGESASKNEFPWIAALVYPGTRRPFCGGSLINSRYILTAAHCFAVKQIPPSKVEVLLHAHLLDQNPFRSWTDPTLEKVPGWNLSTETDESENSIRVKVEEIRVHPMFNSFNFDYDFALLKLAEPVDLVDSQVATICLPLTGQKMSYQDRKTVMTTAGWGVPWEGGPATSRLLQKLDVPYVSNGVCLIYSSTTDRHICAGYLEGGKDACSGDSGGPLIYLTNPATNQYVVSGVVSAGAGCARQGQLGLYSDVEEAIQWIQDNASDGTWCDR